MTDYKEEIRDNYNRILDNISHAAEKSHHDKDVIKIVAATKMQSVEKINYAIELGIDIIGENRLQEALHKLPQINRNVEKHFIGYLQSNKVKKVVENFDVIQSVDSIKLIDKINEKAANMNIIQSIMLEFNVAQENSKHGFYLNEIDTMIERIELYTNINIIGIMTVEPYTDDDKVLRKIFQSMLNLKDKINHYGINNINIKYVSMGMTNDYIIAVEEGSNMVRLGTALFGNRL